MGRTAKLTISLPEELIVFADRLAKEQKISRSKVFSLCLKDLAEKHKVAEMAAGYKSMAQEQRILAANASKIEDEVIPDWE